MPILDEAVWTDSSVVSNAAVETKLVVYVQVFFVVHDGLACRLESAIRLKSLPVVDIVAHVGLLHTDGRGASGGVRHFCLLA